MHFVGSFFVHAFKVELENKTVSLPTLQLKLAWLYFLGEKREVSYIPPVMVMVRKSFFFFFGSVNDAYSAIYSTYFARFGQSLTKRRINSVFLINSAYGLMGYATESRKAL